LKGSRSIEFRKKFLLVSLTHLTFGINFNQKVDNLPQSLKYLKLGILFKAINQLPPLLQVLDIERYTRRIRHLPDSIHTLKINQFSGEIHTLPSSLTTLEFLIYSSKFVIPKSIIPKLNRFMGSLDTLEVLPSTITHLTLWLEENGGKLNHF
jgi:hypothetical protein